jgi:hypothetical protein
VTAAWVGTAQVGGSIAAAGPVTVHESATFPVKPPLGVTVMVDVPVAPGEAMLSAELVSEKAATGNGVPTVTVMNACFKLPARLGESTSSV